MKLDDFDRRMRVYEEAHDICVVPGVYIVARLDGRNFTRLLHEKMKEQAPYSSYVHAIMLGTVKHLVKDSGFRIVYGYTHSDEISLLFHKDDVTFNRKIRKINSVLAGEASSWFTSVCTNGTFDCRVSWLPSKDDVVDYFRWRQAAAIRNSLNSYCFWALLKEGASRRKATSIMNGMKVLDKNEILKTYRVNYADVPMWQKLGTGVYWHKYIKTGINPRDGEVRVTRRKVITDPLLTFGDSYGDFIMEFMNG